MKAITLHQPWASLVALGVKTIETRSWPTKYRGPLAIHAGKGRPLMPNRLGVFGVGHHRIRYADHVDEGYTLARTDGRADEHGITVNPTWQLPLGAVVATCTLVDVVPIVADRLNEQTHVSHGVGGWSRRGDLYLDTYTAGRGTTTKVVSNQYPYGDFSPGRYAWLLDQIEPLAEPVPAKGRQGLWEWTA